MGLQIGYANIYVIPFLDATFALDTSKQVIITPDNIDSADEITIIRNKSIETLVRGSGGKDVYETPNTESGLIELPVLNPLPARLEEFMFPDAIVTQDGLKRKIEFFDNPGLLLSEWDKMKKVIVKPLLASKTEAGANFWLTSPRMVLNPNVEDKFSSVPGKTTVNMIALGGRDLGSVALAVGTIDISGPVDLSSGATDKLMDITIDGTLYANINFGQSATTTTAQILDVINDVVGWIVAKIDASNFLTVEGFQPGGSVIMDDPTAGTTAYTLIYKAAGQPDTINGNIAFNVPTFIRGDETAA